MKKKFMATLFTLTLFFSSSFSQEYKVESLFITKFIENTRWAGLKTNVNVGLVGESETFASQLNSQLGKLKNIKAKAEVININDITSYDVVFISNKYDSNFKSIVRQLSKLTILIITESDLCEEGAGISLVKKNGKTELVINVNSIESHGLKISSSIVNLATKVAG